MKAMLSTKHRPVVLYGVAGQLAEQDCACGAEIIAPVTLFSQPHVHTETDCACPEADSSPLSAESVNARGPWQRAPHLYRAPLPEAHEAVFNSVSPAGIAVLNGPARHVLDAFVAPATLSQAMYHLPDLEPADIRRSVQDFVSLNLLQPTASEYRPPTAPSTSKPTTLTVWLHLTNACNLACTYCYLHKTSEAMDEVTGKSAVEAVFRSALAHDFQVVKLKYAGGEPTLNFSLVRTLHAHAQALAASTGLRLSEVLLTNGVALTPAMLDFIRDAGMRLSISLDGIGATHDAQRVFADGRGTFALVARNIDLALAHEVRPYLSITITARNVHALADVVGFALDRELLFNLNFYRPCGSEGAQHNLRGEDDHLIDGMRRAFAVIESRLPRYSLIGALVDRASFSAPHVRACGAGHSYLVIDQQGRVARCQMEIEHPVTTIFVEDPLAVVRQQDNGFQNISVEERAGCRECRWRYWCAGGCPLLTYQIKGQHNTSSPYCRVYRALFPELVRLEGLRLLKRH